MSPSKAKIRFILESVGVKVDEEGIDAVIIKMGHQHISSFIGEGVVGTAQVTRPPPVNPAEKKEEAKREDEVVIPMESLDWDIFTK